MSILATIADERVADVETTEDELKVRLMDGERFQRRSHGTRACSMQQISNEKTGRLLAPATVSTGKKSMKTSVQKDSSAERLHLLLKWRLNRNFCQRWTLLCKGNREVIARVPKCGKDWRKFCESVI